jgi:formylglycine-generating enzyme required for sulfatase activity
VVEERKMRKVLAVQAFQQTGCTDQTCAVKLGRLLNAKKVITGSLSVLGTDRYLNVRLVDVETGEIEKDETSEAFQIGAAKRVAEEMANRLLGITLPGPGQSAAPPAAIPVKAGSPAGGNTGGDEAPMVLIPAGEFMMGSEKGRADEKPVHKVYLDAFYIDKYEVTFARYDAFCDATGRTKPSDSGWGRGTRPVINISWDDAMAYCEWAGKRLPTEAEWERACRAGTDTAYSFGDDTGMLGTYAWYESNGGRMTHPVGGKQPNGFGLYDMHGNVWEWCMDWYDKKYYTVGPLNNPQGPASGKSRVLRGGSWYYGTDILRSAYRLDFDPGVWYIIFGCRCARTP